MEEVRFCDRCGTRLNRSATFCRHCGTRKKVQTDSVPLLKLATEKEIITSYFLSGFRYEAIVTFLQQYHNITMSLRTLKRRLVSYNLKRRNMIYSESSLKQIISDEIRGPASLCGYRGMWHTLRASYGIVVARDVVMRLLREVDPDGAEIRRSRRLRRRTYSSLGPNQCWHIDGHDKLKPYGFPIHGCVDGFSRRLIWLKVTRSNNDPHVPAYLYVEALQSLGVCPKLIQTDCGTENGIMASMQCALLDDVGAHRFGSSPSNQRIENWWSHGKRVFTTWLINFFKDMADAGKLILGNHCHIECAWFIFSPLIQKELDEVKLLWNTHYIRRSRHDTIPGRPDELYFIPNLSGHENQGISVTNDDVKKLLDQLDVTSVAEQAMNQMDDELKDYFLYVVQNLRKEYPPLDWTSAQELFFEIINTAS